MAINVGRRTCMTCKRRRRCLCDYQFMLPDWAVCVPCYRASVEKALRKSRPGRMGERG